MRDVKQIAEDLIKSGLTLEQHELLEELLAQISEDKAAALEGDDVDES